jgi:tetratricopeptide (TPR) repeat protein
MTHPPLTPRFLTASLSLVLSAGLLRAQVTPAEVATMPADRAVEMAGLQLKLGELDSARSSLQAVLNQDASNFTALRTLAVVELHAKRYAEAERAANAALKLSPDDVHARVVKGSALLRQGRKDPAMKVFATLSQDELQKWSAELPEDAPVAAAEAGAEPGTAAGLAEIDIAPDLDRRLTAFYVAMAQKDNVKADEILRDAETKYSAAPDFIAAKAQYCQETGQQAKALQLLEGLRAAHDIRNGPFPYLLELASAYEVGKQLDKAQEIYGQVAASTDALPEQRQAASQALFELRHNQMLNDGDQALAAGDVDRAVDLSAELVTLAPEDPVVRSFQANVLKAQGRHVEAARIYSSLKAQVQPGKRFDTQLDYAGSLTSARRFDEAIRAYTEIVDNPTVYSLAERKEAQAELDDIRQNSLPSTLTEASYLKMDEGRVWRATGQFSTSRLSNGMRMHVRSGYDDISLSSNVFPESLNTNRWYAVAGMDTALSKRWNGSLFLGSYNDGGMAHALADYNASGGFTASIRAAWNDPARDTFLLEALNGRQNSISINTVVPISKHWAWDTTISGRQINIDGEDIGTSMDAESQVRWHPYGTDKDIYLGYGLDLSDYAPNEKVFSAVEANYFSKTNALFLPSAYDAVPDSIHRHALQAHGSKKLTDDLTAGATVEVAYRQESEQVEYAAMAELLWHASELVDLNARAEYYTSGAGPNIGQNVFLGSLGVKIAW